MTAATSSRLPRSRALGAATALAFSLALSVACAASAASARPPATDDRASGAGSLIVQMNTPPGGPAGQAGEAQARRELARLLASTRAAGAPAPRVGRSIAAGWFVVDAEPARAHALASRLRADKMVASVAVNHREQRRLTPDDPLFTTTDPAQAQWWLRAAAAGGAGVPGMPAAWDRSTGNPASGAPGVIALLDSGVTSHPELNARLLPGYDFVSASDYANDGDGRDNDPSDPGDALPAAVAAAQPALYAGCGTSETSSWHGTLTAGQLAAVSNNGTGVAGLNWSARLVPVRVAGRCGAAVADIIDGLRWAAGLDVAGVPRNPNPARVISLGYGGDGACDAASSDPDTAATARLYQQAIAEIRQQGALVVVAAGNLRHGVGRPASCPGVMAVAALNQQGFKAKYSNFGAEIGIATVGGDGNTGFVCDDQLADAGIVSTSNLGNAAAGGTAAGLTPGAPGYAAGSGTSFAAPVVAGVASLMLAVRPDLSLAQLEAGLKLSARPHSEVPSLGACDATNNTRCGCTTSTCGAGVLDAEQALVYAAAPTTYTAPAWPKVTLASDALKTCAALLGRPDPTAPTDPVTPVEPPASSPDPAPAAGGGGGAVGGGWLLALLAAIVALRMTRRELDGRSIRP